MRSANCLARHARQVPTLRPASSKGRARSRAATLGHFRCGALPGCLMRLSEAKNAAWTPIARSSPRRATRTRPDIFTFAPVPAMKKGPRKAAWIIGDVGPLGKSTKPSRSFPMIAEGNRHQPMTVDVNGGPCAMGHPIGASGARVIHHLLWPHGRRSASKELHVPHLASAGRRASPMARAFL